MEEELLTVFVVDDEPHNLDLVRRTLSGYEVYTFHSASEAFAAATEIVQTPSDKPAVSEL